MYTRPVVEARGVATYFETLKITNQIRRFKRIGCNDEGWELRMFKLQLYL